MQNKLLDGLRFVITGTFGEDRNHIVDKLLSMGAIRHQNISNNLSDPDHTNLLITGVDPSLAKIRKAHNMGINIVDREWLKCALSAGGYTLGEAQIKIEDV
jgi:NAD-dependent DNA ligase